MTDQSLRAKAEAATPIGEPEMDDADLRRIALAATKGPWHYRPREYDDWGWIRAEPPVDGGPVGWLVACARAGHQVSEESEAAHRAAGTDPYEANAAFIAAANPAVVLDLLDRLEAAEKDAAGAKASFLTLRVTANEMQVRAQRAERLLDEAGKALEPFGKLVDDYLADTANFDDDAIMAGRMTHRGEEGTPPRVTFGDFRRARAVQASIRAATEPTEM